MTPTLLEKLIDRAVTTSLLGTLTRTTDRVAEEMAHELLKDPEFRVEMQALIRVAFTKALKGLQDEAPDTDPGGR